MQKQAVIVLGFGGNAIDFFETVTASYTIIGFVDEDKSKWGQEYNSVKVYGPDFLSQNPDAKVISLIGSEKSFKIRHEIIGKFNISSDRFVTAIHPNANVSANAKIGRDVVIMPGVTIPSNAKLGDHVFVLANSVLHHDVEVGDYTLIGSNVTIAGYVKVGRNCFIGSGSSVISNTSIGEFSILGMAANVVKNVGSNAKVVGNPAKEL